MKFSADLLKRGSAKKHEFCESRFSVSTILLERRKLNCTSTFDISLPTLAKIYNDDVHEIPLSVCQLSENRCSERHAQVKFCLHCLHI